MAHCLLSTPYNPDACHFHWLVIFLLIVLAVSIFLFFLAIVANLFRTPWSSSMTVSLDDNRFSSDTLRALQENGGAEAEGILDVCERCGNDADLHEVSKTSTGVLVLCAGCVAYKTFLRSLLPQMFLIFSAYIGWFYGFAVDFFLIDVEIGMCLFIQVFIIIVTAVRFPSVFKYIFSRRQSSSSGEGDTKFLRLNRILTDTTTNFIEKAHKSHKSPIKEILIDGEDILWLEPVSLRSFLKYNRGFHMMLWFICGLPMMWGALGISYQVIGDKWMDSEIAIMGALITIFSLILLLPILISYLVKCRVTYVITNYRALRVNTTPFWFANRVYSFPIYRMLFLHIFTFPNSLEGKVAWLLETDEDAFTQFEYVTNTNEVEEVLKGLKDVATDNQSNVLREELEMTTRHLHHQSNALAALQLLPLIAVIILWVVVFFLDWEVTFISISIVPILPCLWLTTLLHLAWRKVSFLTKCTSTFTAFRLPSHASSDGYSQRSTAAAAAAAAPQSDYELEKAIADEDVYTFDDDFKN